MRAGPSMRPMLFVRVRPPPEPGSSLCVKVQSPHRVVHVGDGSSDGRPPRVAVFDYDRVLGPESTQGEVFEGMADVVDSCLQGYHSAIFVYGTTGAGKTHTLLGALKDGAPPEQHGLALRAIERLLQRGASLKLSFLEIYNRELRDLLPAEDLPKGPLRICKAKRGGNYVDNLATHPVFSVEQARRLVREGASRRQTEGTLANAESSRSHAVLTVDLAARETNEDGSTVVRRAQLNLVDLAGSEGSEASGECKKRQTEAVNINVSLTTLRRVITALSEGQQHIPYRDSKLTRLLQESLGRVNAAAAATNAEPTGNAGGKSKIAIIANVHPSMENAAESYNTLAFVAKAKTIQLKVTASEAEVVAGSTMHEENMRLRAQLAELQSAMAHRETAAAEAAATVAEAYQAEIERLLEELATLRADERAAEAADHAAKCAAADAARSALEDENAELRESQRQLQAKLEAATLELGELRSREAQQQRAAQVLAEDRAALSAAQQRLEQEAAAMLAEVEDAKAKLTQWQEDVCQGAAKLKQREELMESRQRAAALRASNEKVAEIIALQAANDRMEEQLAEALLREQEASAQLQALQADNRTLHGALTQLQPLQADNRALPSAQLQALQADNRDLQAENHALRAQLAGLEAKLSQGGEGGGGGMGVSIDVAALRRLEQRLGRVSAKLDQRHGRGRAGDQGTCQYQALDDALLQLDDFTGCS